MKLYPLADSPTLAEKKMFGSTKSEIYLPSAGLYCGDIRAVSTGERRCPKRGEWYLSGAIAEAYRARNDLSAPYHIARLVKTKTETFTTVTVC